MHGKIQSCSGDQLLIVHVARLDPGRSTVEAAIGFRWRFANAAEKWMQRNLNSRSELGQHALPVQGNDLDTRIREVIRQEACPGSKPVIGVRNSQLDLLNSHLQRVPRLGAFNVDRPCENVPARTFVGDLLVDVAQALLHLLRRYSRLLQPCRAVRDQRVDDHGVARVNAKHGRCSGVVITPSHGLRRGFQGVSLRPGRCLGPCKRQEQKETYQEESLHNDTNPATRSTWDTNAKEKPFQNVALRPSSFASQLRLHFLRQLFKDKPVGIHDQILDLGPAQGVQVHKRNPMVPGHVRRRNDALNLNQFSKSFRSALKGQLGRGLWFQWNYAEDLLGHSEQQIVSPLDVLCGMRKRKTDLAYPVNM